MKTIGLIGGMTWESTLEYYRLINREVGRRLGGVHSARLILHSVDFDEIAALMDRKDWPMIARMMADAACKLQDAGADFVLFCTNTIHKVADEVAGSMRIPFLHIADPTGAAIAAKGLRRVGLLGTRYTMEMDFYRARLNERYGFEVLVPESEDRGMIHDVIFEELSLGILRDESRKAYRRVMSDLIAGGAEGIILGCTEIPLLIRQEDVAVPIFDTMALHVGAAVDLAIGM